MATGASTADLAVVLVDARQGVLRQTRRHSIIASLLGIRHIVLAVNKIDLVGYDRDAFDAIVADYTAFAADLGFRTVVPSRLRRVSATTSPAAPTAPPGTRGRHCSNIWRQSTSTPTGEDRPFRFPVQYVNRPNLDFRGFAGTVASGSIARGDDVVVAKSGKLSRVRRIVAQGGDLQRAVEGQAVTLVLEDEVELSRGNMLVSPYARPHVADQFAANLVWFDEAPLLPGRAYLLRTETGPGCGDRHRPAIPLERQRLRRGGRDHARDERGGRRQSVAAGAHRLRRLRRQPRHRAPSS